MNTPYHKNAPGAFFVEDGCCITCGVMHESKGGRFFEWDEKADSSHCYIKLQPETKHDLQDMIKAMKVSDVDCVFYKGCNKNWQKQLRQNGLGGQICKQDSDTNET